jgi:hypothetical protein
MDNKYYFIELDMGSLGRDLVIVNEIYNNNGSYEVEYTIAYIWPEDFDTGEQNPVEDWDEYYDYTLNQVLNDKFCTIEGMGSAVLVENDSNLCVKKMESFYSNTYYDETSDEVNNSENVDMSREDEAYEVLKSYWISIGKRWPENVEYEGYGEHGYCFWGYNSFIDHAVTFFRIEVDLEKGTLFDVTNDKYLE